MIDDVVEFRAELGGAPATQGGGRSVTPWKIGTSGRLGLSNICLWLETGQRLGLILKGRDRVCYPHNPQHVLDPTTRTDQFQATALAAKGNVRPNGGANARTIQLRHVCQVQQHLPRSIGDQLSQMGAQKVPTIANCRSSPKVQNSDITGFAD